MPLLPNRGGWADSASSQEEVHHSHHSSSGHHSSDGHHSNGSHHDSDTHHSSRSSHHHSGSHSHHKHRHRNRKKRKNARQQRLGIGIAVIVCVIIAVLFFKMSLQEQQYTQEAQDSYEQEKAAQRESEEQAARELAEKESSYSFYEKLAEGISVNILIVGDSIGAGEGAETSSCAWFTQLEEYLEEKYYTDSAYNGTVTVTNISMKNSTVYSGYVRVAGLDDTDYDLVVICYGMSDDAEDFGWYYEGLIRILQERYSGCSIISVLESILAEDTQMTQTLQELSSFYDLMLADTIEAFESAAASLDLYDADGMPNDDGQTLYYKTLKKIVDDNVTAQTGKSTYITDVYAAGADIFDQYVYCDLEDDSGDGVTFTCMAAGTGMLSIDYDYAAGECRADIYIDGELLETSGITYNYDYTNRRILILSESITAKSEISIVFESVEQTEGFYGLCFTYE